MNDIDKIFSKLQNHKVKAPDIWDKIDAQLQNGAASGMKSGLENSVGKASATKLGSSVILKAVAIISAIGVITSATYLFISNDTTNVSNQTAISTNITQSIESSPQISEQNHTNPIQNDLHTSKDNNQSIQKSSDTKESEQIFEHNEFVVVEPKTATIPPSLPSLVKPVESSISNHNSITPQHVTPYSKIIEQEVHNNSESNLSPIIIPNVFTPNGDGINDYFEIINIEKYPKNNLIIFDRAGNTVARYTGYRNEFNGQNLPAGTYFYKLEYGHLDQEKTKVGCVEILRK